VFPVHGGWNDVKQHAETLKGGNLGVFLSVVFQP